MGEENKTQKTISPPVITAPQKRPGGHERLIAMFLVGYMCLIGITMMADAKIVWTPWDIVGSIVSDVQYLMSNPAKDVPDVSQLSSTLPVERFVDKQFIPALELIHRDPQFKYLADMVVQHKIPMTFGSPNDFTNWENMAKYWSSCPGNVGKVIVNPANTYPTLNLAGVFVHELTHAYDQFNKADYYCVGDGKRYLSLETNAFSKEAIFRQKYDRFAFMSIFTKGGIDLRGNVNDYCLYYKTRKIPTYAASVDDVHTSPGPNEEFICHVATFS